VVVVVRPGLDASVVLTTFLEPIVDAPVPARHAGIVRTVAVTEGQRVRRGEVLAQLEYDEQRIEVERTGALAAQALAEYDCDRAVLLRLQPRAQYLL
jgi:multidrug efflux pump subunit AcrA (membrane-fusion protein)